MRSRAVLRAGLPFVADISWVCPSCVAKESRSTRIAALPIPKQSLLRSSGIRNYATRQRDGKLPDFPARTRFAPSPTGFMHIGGLRTALFSYLLAKTTGGQFILRVEDTDQKRFVEGAIERLCADLRWAGVQWDEGPEVGGDFGPYQQSHRTEIYQRHARTLLDNGTAYSCFCNPQTEGIGSQAYVTSGCYQNCSSLGSDEASSRRATETHTIRLKQPHDVRSRKYPDLIYGNIKRLKRTPGAAISGDDQTPDAADTILMKSDGTPTYHFANVIDDHLMQITHVIRGTEWMASTPLHYDLYQAFGWQPPVFAHVGLLLDHNKAKLSKRNADLTLDVQGLKDEHDVLPESLCNFLALQGWSNPTKSDVMDMKALIENFDLKFTTGNTIVGMEKLWFLQRNHVERRCQQAREQRTIEPIQPLVSKIVDAATEMHSDSIHRSNHIGNLADFCTLLLLVDDRSFRDAKQFVRRNAYFFGFDSGRAPDRQHPKVDEAYNDTLSVLATIFNDEGLIQAVEVVSVDSVIARYQQLEQAHTRVNKVIAEGIWTHVLGQKQASGLATRLAARTNNEEIAGLANISEEEAADMLQRFQTTQKLVMKQLRSQLCSGNPGPSIGFVIALLGVEECRRRLQLS